MKPKRQQRPSRSAKPATIWPETGGRYELRASDPGFFGVRMGVQFKDGVGHTSDPITAAELAATGFEMVEKDGGK